VPYFKVHSNHLPRENKEKTLIKKTGCRDPNPEKTNMKQEGDSGETSAVGGKSTHAPAEFSRMHRWRFESTSA
jgi:hypothetical protein